MMTPVLDDIDKDWLTGLDVTASQQALLDRCTEAWKLCLEVYGDLPCPRIWFDLRGKTAGQAHFGRGGLRFNPVLYDENRYAFLINIVPHEMAHWLVDHLEGSEKMRPHGHEWKTVMRELFGLAPDVTHCFDTGRASPAPHIYACSCMRHTFTNRRHGLVLGGKRYHCRSCLLPLTYLGRNEDIKVS
ncbi:MAG: SprT family zinc-dependent metalloprotease [Halomonas sp.]